jgi:peptidyl-prolyl cis-trans isomerase A (cyclophilin A)
MFHLLVLSGFLLTAPAVRQAMVHVVIQTDLGEIEMEIDTVKAPATSANFLKYVDAGLYDGGLFHRTVRPDNQREKPVKIAVIQAAANAGRKNEFFPPIALERTNKTGVQHKDGTVSMARAGVDTATQEFFICVGDQPDLDFGGKRNADGQGFAAFARVVRGMDIVRRIQESTADGETLRPPIKIIRLRRVSARL